MALRPAPSTSLDRTTQPPFLLHLFHQFQNFHSPSAFATVPPTPDLRASSLQIYTWPNATLSELTRLLLAALPPDALPQPLTGTRLGFRLLFPDTRSVGPGAGEGAGRWLSRDVGSVVVADDWDGGDRQGLESDGLSGDANKSLADAKFVIGDYVSCAILPPHADGSVAALPLAERSGGPRRGELGGGWDASGRGRHGDRGGRGRGAEGYREDRGWDGQRYEPNAEWSRGERAPDGYSHDRGGGRRRSVYD